MFVRSLTGQSAIEYLMTYGWMLLVVAVVGGAIFSVAQQQSVESVSGFTGEDVLVDNFGTNAEDELQMVLRNGGAEKIELNTVTVSDGENEAVWKPIEDRSEIDVSDTQVATFLQIQEGSEANNLDVRLNYDQGGLTNLESSGSVSGSFEIIDNTEFYDMDPFVLHVNSTRPGDTNDTQFKITTGGGNFNYQVTWENLDDGSEGEIIDPLTGDHTLNFESPGMHKVEIRGLFPHHSNFDNTDAEKIESLEAWGDVEWTSFLRSFQLASNMEGNYDDRPDLSRVSNAENTFRQAYSFDGKVSDWETSSFESTHGMFRRSNISGDFSEWDVSNVKNMDAMFHGADNFNNDISSWNTSNVNDMTWLFNGASSFDQDISSWCVEKIDEKPWNFDRNTAFEGEDSKQPNWGASC